MLRGRSPSDWSDCTQSTVEFARPDSVRFRDPTQLADLDGAVPILVAAFDQGISFVDALAEGRGPAGELLIDTRARPPKGTELIAEIRWPGLPNRVYLRVVVRGRTGDGMLVLRIDPDEVIKRDFLVHAACGTASCSHRRRHRRYCVRLPLEWRRFGTRVMRNGLAEDISTGGMLVVTADSDVAVGDEIVIRIQGKVDLVLTGRAQHIHRRRGGGETAIGVQFEYRGSGQTRTLRQILRTCSARGVMFVV